MGKDPARITNRGVPSLQGSQGIQGQARRRGATEVRYETRDTIESTLIETGSHTGVFTGSLKLYLLKPAELPVCVCVCTRVCSVCVSVFVLVSVRVCVCNVCACASFF